MVARDTASLATARLDFSRPRVYPKCDRDCGSFFSTSGFQNVHSNFIAARKADLLSFALRISDPGPGEVGPCAHKPGPSTGAGVLVPNNPSPLDNPVAFYKNGLTKAELAITFSLVMMTVSGWLRGCLRTCLFGICPGSVDGRECTTVTNFVSATRTAT